MTCLLCVQAIRVAHRLGHRGEVYVPKSGTRRRPFHLGDPQQRGESLEEPFRLAKRGVGRRIRIRNGSCMRPRILQPLIQPRKRRTQIMRNVAADLAQAVHQSLSGRASD